MGRAPHTKRRRSSRPVIRQSQRPKKILNPLGNGLIAKNWDKRETMTQNYRRLGLLARLKAPTGGVEKRIHQKVAKQALAIQALEDVVVTEARVQRDADGRIVAIVRPGTKNNPLRDPLNEFDSDGDDYHDDDPDSEYEDAEEWAGIEDAGSADEQTEIVRQLEEEAARAVAPPPRHVSEQGGVALERLVARYGDDVAAMARDRRLNPFQRTEGDLARRIRRWKGT